MYNQLHPIRRCKQPDGNVKFSDISATAPGPQQTGGGRAQLRSYVPAPHGRCRDAAAESVPTPARSPSAPPRSPLPVQRAGVRPGRTTEPPGSPACNRVSYVARTAPHVGTRTVARPLDGDTHAHHRKTGVSNWPSHHHQPSNDNPRQISVGRMPGKPCADGPHIAATTLPSLPQCKAPGKQNLDAIARPRGLHRYCDCSGSPFLTAFRTRCGINRCSGILR